MKAWHWIVLAAAGFGLMLAAFGTRARPDPSAPAAAGFLAIGSKPLPEPSPNGAIPARLRLLPVNERTELLIRMWKQQRPNAGLTLESQLRPKLILVRPGDVGLGAESLRTGRLPKSEDEILAGPGTVPKDRLQVDKRTLTVVGVLRSSASLFADSYLLPPSESAASLFPSNDPAVHDAAVVCLTEQQSRDRELTHKLNSAYPDSRFAKFAPSGRLDRRTFYAVLAGQAVLLFGGSGAMIRLYRNLARRVHSAVLAPPLLEIECRRALLGTVHLVYFGLVIAGSVLIYELPELQALLLSAVREEIGGSKGPLGIAGKAYGSGNIPWAAAVTFLINFFLGSIASITLPSMVVPGIGAVLAAFRALMWGLLLAPTFVKLAGPMLAHSWTMLLEGEGYILATFFSILIPIHLVQPSEGTTLRSRYGRALRLNLQANALVALVLAVAACYEATEVILMAR